MLLQSDHSTFTLDDKPIKPAISNVVTLDCGLESTLDFDAIEKSEFYDLDFGLANPSFHLDKELPFRAFEKAILHFNEKICDSDVKGVCLYKGSADFSTNFPWTPNSKTHFEEFLIEQNATEKTLESCYLTEHGRHLIRIFCMNSLVEYLHKLIAALPEAVAGFAFFDVSTIKNPVYLHSLLSKSRLLHLEIAVSGNTFPLGGLNWIDGDRTGVSRGGVIATSIDLNKDCLTKHLQRLKEEAKVGVLFPADEKLTEAAATKYFDLLKSLDDKLINYRVVPEIGCIEHIGGLDYIIAIKEYSGPYGIRGLQGFAAAEGTAVYTDEKLGIPYEIPLSVFFGDKL